MAFNDAAIPLRINQLSIKAGENRYSGRIGAGKSTLLQAMMGNIELVSGELRLDDLSLPQIDPRGYSPQRHLADPGSTAVSRHPAREPDPRASGGDG